MKRRHSYRIASHANLGAKIPKTQTLTSSHSRLRGRTPKDGKPLASEDRDPASLSLGSEDQAPALSPLSISPPSTSFSLDITKPKRIRTIYLHSKVYYVGDVDLRSQSFGCSFDLNVCWDPADAPSEDFDPLIRFPEAVTTHETLRVSIPGETLVGYRATIEGRFRSKMDLRMFPFDAQPLMVEMQLGRCKATGSLLTHTEGWRLTHHPREPNILANQIDNEHIFRPCRFSRCLTGPLESYEVMCKYELWIPVERDWTHYVINHYFFTFMVCFLNCMVPFWLPVTDLSNRIMAVLTLYLLLVTYKFSVSGALPVLPYNTALDRYILWNFFLGFTSLLGLFYVNEDSHRNLQVQKLVSVMAVLIHVWVVTEVLLARKTRLMCISGAGSIDPVMKRVLDSNGVDLNNHGLVADRPKYTALQQSTLITDSN